MYVYIYLCACKVKSLVRVTEWMFWIISPATTSFWREFASWTHICLESPGWEQQDASLVRANGARGACKLLINTTFEVQIAVFGHPLLQHQVFGGNWPCAPIYAQKAQAESYKMQHWIRANRARGGSTSPSRMRSKSPFSHILQTTPTFWWVLAM